MRSVFHFFSCFLISIASVFSQNNVEQDTTNTIDTRYKEDQFYFAVTYNLMANKPSHVSQTGFSSGFHLGLIKDIPLNKRRNFAFGFGLGLARNSFNHNLFINKNSNGDYEYIKLNESEITHTKNRIINYLVELPLEFRWRTSTAQEYKFWRIYTGVKLGYSLYNISKYDGSLGKIKHENLEHFNAFQYGATLSFGYNTWNFHVYYALHPMFNNDASINGTKIDTKEIRLGLIFYLL